MYIKALFWVIFLVFASLALYFNWHNNIFSPNGPIGLGRCIVWTIFIGFLAYTVYCTNKENLFKSIKQITTLHWGRQIGIDLYIGFSLSLFLIYLNERSLLILLLWILPIFIFGNIATLLYFAINFDSLVSKFLK